MISFLSFWGLKYLLKGLTDILRIFQLDSIHFKVVHRLLNSVKLLSESLSNRVLAVPRQQQPPGHHPLDGQVLPDAHGRAAPQPGRSAGRPCRNRKDGNNQGSRKGEETFLLSEFDDFDDSKDQPCEGSCHESIA
jgi:hypothetical protein